MPVKANHDGYLVEGAIETLHASGPGRLLGYLISHREATAQEVVFYDSPTASNPVLHRVFVAPEQSPVYIRFGQAERGRAEALRFSTGLTVDPGNCAVVVWSIGY
jgi:hypothetical protein